LLALVERQTAQVVSIEVNQVEGIIEDLNLRISRDPLPPFANAGALLHQAKGGPSVSIESNDLSVKHSSFRFHKFWDVLQFAELNSQIVLCTRNQTQHAIFNKRNRAIAIPFDFVQPGRIVEGVFRR